MKNGLLILGLLALLASACSHEDEGGAMLVGGDGADTNASAMDERTARMNIQIDALDKNGTVIASSDVAPDAFRLLAQLHCQTLNVPFGVNEVPAGRTSLGSSEVLCGSSNFTWASVSDLPSVGTTCTAAFCAVQWKLCEAHRLLELVDAVGPTRMDLAFHTGDGIGTYQRYRVGPQDAASKARLSELAYEAAAKAAVIAADNLKSVGLGSPAVSFERQPDTNETNPFVGCGLRTGANPSDPELAMTLSELATFEAAKPIANGAGGSQNVLESFTMGMVEGTYVAQEAIDKAAEHYKAVGDAEFSRSTEVSDVAKLAWTDPQMSRARAAHLIVGGAPDSELHYLWGEGFCPLPDPSEEVKRAMKVFRSSAADPKRVFDMGIPVNRLIEGDGGQNGAKESIRARLAERLNRPELLRMSAAELAVEFEVSVDALQAAREYLKHEAKAFGRDLSVKLPQTPIGIQESGVNGALANVFSSTPNFAAMASPPVVPPTSYYAGITRFSRPWNITFPADERQFRGCAANNTCTSAWETCITGMGCYSDTEPVVPRWHGLTDRGLIHLIDYVASAAHDLSALPAGTTYRSMPDNILDTVAAFAATMKNQRPARLETCRQLNPATKDKYRFRIYGAQYAEEFKVVRGTAGLRCAVEGHIENAPCSLSDWVVPTVSTANSLVPSARRFVGFSQFAELVVDLDVAATDTDWLFVVRKRQGLPDSAGNYTQHGYTRTYQNDNTKWPWPVKLGTWDACETLPIVPEYETMAATLITPSVENCRRPNETCAGFEFAERIPLENELTSDGDGVENSWRRYLGLAKDAAELADKLGEELIQAGYEIDDRIEMAEADLEGICGGVVSLRDLSWGSFSDARGGDCVDGAKKACADQPGFVCMNGKCVRDLEERIDALDEGMSSEASANLAACLGDEGKIDYATLGSMDVCIWRDNSESGTDKTSGEICTPLEGVGKPCPFVIGEGEEGICEKDSDLTLPDGYEPILVENHLEIFHTLDPANNNMNDTTFDLSCDLIRTARKRAASGDTKGAQAAVKQIVDSGALTWDTVRRYADRVGFQPYPDDYAAITFDDQPKWHTGYPMVESADPPNAKLTSPRWPCYGAHDNALDEPQDGPREKETGCKVDDSQTLFETRTCACDGTDQPSHEERARMNYRMARAVLALKISTGVGLTRFHGPYRPVTRNILWFESKGAESCNSVSANRCDYKGLYFAFDEAASAKPLWGGRLINEANNVRFNVKNEDWGWGNDDEAANINIPGQMYCWQSDSARGNTVWTHLDDDGADATFRFDRTCAEEGVRHKWNDNDLPLIFEEYDPMSPNEARAAALWKGLTTGNAAFDEEAWADNKELEGLLKTLLTSSSTDSVQISREHGLTSYWDFCKDHGNDRAEFDSCSGALHHETFNLSKIAENGLTGRDLLDGLELLCEVASEEEGGCGEPTTPRTFQDLSRARNQLKCIADSMLSVAQAMVVKDVPVDVLPEKSDPHTYEGTRGDEVSKLVAAYNDLHEYQNKIADEVSAFSDDVEKLRLMIKKLDISQQLAKLDQQSALWNQMSACAMAMTQGAEQGTSLTSNMDKFGSNWAFAGAKAAITCGNALAQIALSYERLDLQEQSIKTDGEIAWVDFRARFKQHHSNLEGYTTSLNSALHRIAGSTAAIEAHRQQARRHLGRGLMLSSDSAGRQFATNSVMRARYNTALLRYQRALLYAKRMTYLARRSLEQRLGVDLNTIHEDLALVERPSKWVEQLCELQGVDYQKIAKGELDGEVTTNDGQTLLGHYADAYIGDYVRKLDAVFESYSIDYPFTDGQDTAVVSVRDDIVLSRNYCPVSVNNLLAESAELDRPAWESENCVALAPKGPLCSSQPIDPETGMPPGDDCNDGTPTYRDCVSARRLAELTSDPSQLPIPTHYQPFAPVDGFRVTFGGAVAGQSSFVSREPTGLPFTSLLQRVVLTPGVYRLSWRGKATTSNHDPQNAVGVSREIVSVNPATGQPTTEIKRLRLEYAKPVTGYGWPLYYAFFEVLEDDGSEQELRIEILPQPGTKTTHTVDLAAFMLEDVTNVTSFARTRADANNLLPPGYAATHEPGIAMMQVCEDTSGEFFRKGWHRGCTKVCPGGAPTCERGTEQCYWERNVNLPLEEIEDQSRLSRAGFAFGNFNYRTDSVALNFVGTSTRDCSSSTNPSTCYAGGFIPYSVYHIDGFDVRNYRGERYHAPLFRGAIEHARGLAAERYLTNPLSDADRSLIEPYLRNELQGRPLPGTYVIRIWEQDGVSFDGIEDIQLLLNYRYWTRND